MAMSLQGSVGRSHPRAARNEPNDIVKVKRLLIAAGYPLTVSDRMDDDTITAIENYQSAFLSNPDGRVDPGGTTLRRLNNAVNPDRQIFRLIVHHTAGPKDSDVPTIRRHHLARGFSDIGYHTIIRGGGEIQAGRPQHQMGAHAKGANADTLGVSVCGNFENEHPNTTQIDSLILVLTAWCRNYVVWPGNIKGHREVGTTATACPGRNLFSQLLTIQERVRAQLAAEERQGVCLAQPLPVPRFSLAR